MNLLINGLIALGTIAVAALAIWGDWVRSRLAPLKLSIEPHNDFRGDPNVLSDPSGAHVDDAMYFHLKVVNKRPWLSAKNCRVLIKGIDRKAPDGEFRPAQLVVPAQLTWAPVSFSPALVTITGEQVLDLGSIRRSTNVFVPALYSIPNNFQGFVRSNESVRFKLSAEADNYSSAEITVIEVSWDGTLNFAPEQMARHLVIKKVHKP